MADISIEYFELDPNIEYVKIYGLQRSGTNFVSDLINKNFENTQVLVNYGGWKHGHYAAPWTLGQEVNVAVVAKNPYAWLVSVYNYWGPNRKKNIGPDLAGVPFEEFVKNRVCLEYQKSIPYLIRASNPIQYWNNMYFHWSSVRLGDKKICMIAYEAFLMDAAYNIEILGKVLGLKPKEQVTVSEKTFEPAGEQPKESDEAWRDREYYVKQNYLKMYNPKLIEFVNQQLDIEMMLQFGYDYVLPESLETK